MVKYNTIIPRQ